MSETVRQSRFPQIRTPASEQNCCTRDSTSLEGASYVASLQPDRGRAETPYIYFTPTSTVTVQLFQVSLLGISEEYEKSLASDCTLVITQSGKMGALLWYCTQDQLNLLTRGHGTIETHELARAKET